MASQEGTAKSAQFIVICTAPDVCKSPGAPVPYQIVAFLSQSVFTSPNVRFKGVPAFDMASRVATVIGDEAGIGGGVVSGVFKGFCRPITPVPTVRTNGFPTCRHDYTQFLMNCAGPDGPANTIGKVVYLGAMLSAPVGPGGSLPSGANSIVAAESPGELGCLGSLDSIPGMGGGLSDIVGLAQKAYNLAKTDWSNPMAALGAIGGLAGMAGLGSVARTAALAQKAYGLAKTDWSNPGAAVGAALGIAGPVIGAANSGSGTALENLTDAAKQVGSDLLDTAGKLWTLPNTALGVALGGAGTVVQGIGHVFNPTKYAAPGIGFGNNAIEFTNNALVRDGWGITLGNAINYSPGSGGPTAIGDHEQAHTYQAQQLGPFYLPAWLLGAGVAGVQGQDPFGSGNFMEHGPHRDQKPW